MSRHRALRNMDIDDELAMDDYDDEHEYAGATAQQNQQLAAGLASIRDILGPGFTDHDIKSALWNYYFDQEQSIAYLLEQQQKSMLKANKTAAAKGAKTQGKQLPTPTKPVQAADKHSTKAQAQALSSTKASPSASTASKPGVKMAQSGTSETVTQLQQDLNGLGLADEATDDHLKEDVTTLPTVSMAREKLLEHIHAKESEEGYKPVISMVVIGHVDAGKSTLMGRLLADLGEMSDKAVRDNQRQSDRAGKGSFGYAWAFDALPEERARGVTIDIGIDHFSTPHRQFTLLDAPGHRDFVPNMISGAAQADTALLVVDASTGGFESGFINGGQTREHALLVRSFGVQQLVVAVNKLDAVDWSQQRYDYIVDALKPFLEQAGYNATKLTFVPCGAVIGENLVYPPSTSLKKWYSGPTLIHQLDSLAVPERALEAPLRLPIANVFRSQSAGTSGLGVSGRIESGIVQVGERLAVLPGDESGIVKSIDVDGENVSYAVAGSNTTIYLAAIDPVYVNVGCILCSPSHLVPLTSHFAAQIVTFDLSFPLTAGSAVELFHHSKDVSAVITRIDATLDKTTGAVIKTNPRMVSKSSSARVQIKIRPAVGSNRSNIAIETFANNKGMGRILMRRGGETVAAGIVTDLY